MPPFTQDRPAANLLGAKPSVRSAYRNILRYIHAQGLGAGDKLPTQLQLRKTLALGNDTLDEAMKMLVAHGVLKRQQKVGTMVCDPTRPALAVWTAGITQCDHEGFGFGGIFEFYLRKFMVEAGCEDRTFFRPVPAQDRPHVVEDFHGLAEAIEAEQLDLVVTQEHLLTDKVLTFHMNSGPDVRFGYVLDDAAVTTTACNALAQRGCHRLAIIGAPSDYLSHYRAKRMREGFEQLGNAELTLEFIPYEGQATFGGHDAAARLLNRPPSARPSGLIVMDDYVTLGLADRLRENADYHPAIIAMTNRQAPLAFARPVQRLEIDIEQIARGAVNMISARLLNPNHPLAVAKWTPTLIEDSHRPDVS